MNRAWEAGPVGEMVRRIVAGFDPVRVILFGSLARGEGTRHSDADLLVVFEEVEKEDKRRLTIEVMRALADVPFPTDVVVTDLEEIERRGHVVGTVLRPALREGKVLYERPERPVLSRAEGSGGVNEERGQERVFSKALELFEGDSGAAERWLSSPKRALGGAVPCELAETEAGAREVEALIGRLEHGVFS